MLSSSSPPQKRSRANESAHGDSFSSPAYGLHATAMTTATAGTSKEQQELASAMAVAAALAATPETILASSEVSSDSSGDSAKEPSTSDAASGAAPGTTAQKVIHDHHQGNCTNATLPVDEAGRVYHVGVGFGEVSPRVLSVGSESRAAMLASFMDDGGPVFVRHSSRGFVTHTGRVLGQPLSIIATGMGVAMMDFLVREVCVALTDPRSLSTASSSSSAATITTTSTSTSTSSSESTSGHYPLAMVRYGTCGGVRRGVQLGAVSVASHSLLVQRQVDYFHPAVEEENSSSSAPSSASSSSSASTSAPTTAPYYFSRLVPGDAALLEGVRVELERELGADRVLVGENATADSFYSSQGRADPNFEDANQSLIEDLLRAHPTLATLEMETFQLYHLAKCRRQAPLHAAAATIVLAQRETDKFLEFDRLHQVEREGGLALLHALAKFQFADGSTAHPLDSDPRCVWNQQKQNVAAVTTTE